MTYRAGVTVDALESTSIQLVLADEVVYSAAFDNTSSMGLHMLVCAGCGDSCSWHLLILLVS